jgi:hypothetical protein
LGKLRFDGHHSQLAATAAVGLEPAINEIKRHPELTGSFIEGIIRELEIRGFFDEKAISLPYKLPQPSA